MDVSCRWRADFSSAEVEALHAASFDHPPRALDWRAKVERHSLGWVCAYQGERLVGFVNLAWDGREHAFILDTMVAEDVQHSRVGTTMIEMAVHEARRARCAWLHVDYEDALGGFYVRACGFTPSAAGVLALA